MHDCNKQDLFVDLRFDLAFEISLLILSIFVAFVNLLLWTISETRLLSFRENTKIEIDDVLNVICSMNFVNICVVCFDLMFRQ